MDLTQGTQEEKNERAKKMMLWFGIASLIMAFAALTSAYIVSSSREDWIKDLELPTSFLISTIVIIISSLTYFMAKKATNSGNSKMATSWLLVTLVLGVAFVVLQFSGFSEMVAKGYYFTGPTSNIKTSYVFAIVLLHIAHVAAGLISLLVVVYNHVKGKYTSDKMLGLELGATFWHFLGILWVYLILFIYFVN
ncbi:MAG: cytochrome oxidase subunit III [Flavobacteriaceae bacterium]|nr:MAG: cytochrome oxidase subunit III [Flavobacteriaceae bacterium]